MNVVFSKPHWMIFRPFPSTNNVPIYKTTFVTTLSHPSLFTFLCERECGPFLVAFFLKVASLYIYIYIYIYIYLHIHLLYITYCKISQKQLPRAIHIYAYMQKRGYKARVKCYLGVET